MGGAAGGGGWGRRFRLPWRTRRQIVAEVDEEIRFHLEMRAAELVAGGTAPGEARRRASAEFGDVDAARRSLREADEAVERRTHRREWRDALLQDARYALRALRRSPGFAVVAVLTLALGIGATTTIFSLVDAVLLRPPPHVRGPERLAGVYTSDFSGPLYGASSYPDYLDFRAGVRSFSDLAALTNQRLSLDTGGETVQVTGALVTGNYFSLLGVEPALGRLLLPGEGVVPGRDAVVVLSHGAWLRRFGGDPGVVGSTVRLGGDPFTVVGVAPAGFAGVSGREATELWAPLGMEPSRLVDRRSRGLALVGRLRDGAGVEDAAAELAGVARSLYEREPDAWTDVRDEPREVTVVPASAARVPVQQRAGIVGFLGMLGGMVGLVLLIACANVANLLLARATGRRREIAVRLAVGAGRGRIVRQLLTESLVLAGVGGAAGVALALAATELVGAANLSGILPFIPDVRLDARVLGFAVGATLATGLLFGLLPALQAARPALVPALKGEAPTRAAHGHWLRSVLVVGQVSLCVVLLVCAALFLRSLRNAVRVELGFDPSGVVVVPLSAGVAGFDETATRRLHAAVLERVRALPGVESVALAEVTPLGERYQRRTVRVPGYEPAPGEDMEFDYGAVTPEYFATLRTPVVRGRAFSERDRAGEPRVVIVNGAFARRFWPGEDPVGRQILLSASDPEGIPAEVVGVVADTKIRSIGEEPRVAYYLPLAQEYEANMVLHARTAGDPAAILGPVRSELRRLAPDIPTDGARTYEAVLGGQLLRLRLAGSLFSAFGLLALVVAMVGLYGVVSYTVASRTRELGIRIALGAGTRRVHAQVLRQGVLLAVVGVGIGTAIALLAARLVAGFLFGVDPADPLGLSVPALVLLLVAALASWLPARRATRVDPVVALRAD